MLHSKYQWPFTKQGKSSHLCHTGVTLLLPFGLKTNGNNNNDNYYNNDKEIMDTKRFVEL